jgi:M6 family metalloprotease-like protein
VLTALLALSSVAAPALAVAPPRPGAKAAPPAVLADWPAQRPGALSPVRLAPAVDKNGASVLHLPVVPGGFSDRAGTAARSTLQAVFTGSGSVSSYWTAASGGRLDIRGDVSDWRRAPNAEAWYAGDHHGLDLWSAPRNAGRFVWDIVAAADAAGFDWSGYDNDGPDGVPNSGDDDGVVDAVMVMHAGEGGECGGDGLWSHAFFLAGWGYGRYTTATPRTGGGFLQVDDYVLVPERSCDAGVIEIGVICHELGHVLGLPDLYDTEGGRAGIGGWGLMGSGGWGGDGQHPDQPTLPSAWSRRELGWCATDEIRQAGPATLPAATTEDRVLLLRDEAMPAGEYFLIENRRRAGVDVTLPGEGLLVWHVDEGVIGARRALNTVNAGAVWGVALEQADGLDQLGLVGGGRGDAGDPWPGAGGALRFAAGTLPSSHDNAGARTDVVVRAIAQPADPVTFYVENGVFDLDVTPPAVTVILPAGGEQWTLGDVVTVVWTALDEGGVAGVDLHLSRDGGLTFPVTLACDLPGGSYWTGNLGQVPGEAMVLRITARDAEGNTAAATSQPFALVDRYAPGVVLGGGPLAGAVLDPGDPVSVSWQTADNVGVVAVDLELSLDGGGSWSATELTGLAPQDGVTWTVPQAGSTRAVLRAAARDAAGNVGYDQSALFVINGLTTDVPDVGGLSLGPCVPNPFNPRAEIVFDLAAAGAVRLDVHDAAGRRVRRLLDAWRPAGRQSVIWDGRDDQGRGAASGVYWVRASGPGGRALLKATLVR